MWMSHEEFIAIEGECERVGGGGAGLNCDIFELPERKCAIAGFEIRVVICFMNFNV